MLWGSWYVRAAIQKDLGRLEKWPDGNFMQFNKHINKVQHLRTKSPPCNATCWGWLYMGCSADRALGDTAEGSPTRAP